jgi:hypothetical protein
VLFGLGKGRYFWEIPVQAVFLSKKRLIYFQKKGLKTSKKSTLKIQKKAFHIVLTDLKEFLLYSKYKYLDLKVKVLYI